jgi:hypothetical protein
MLLQKTQLPCPEPEFREKLSDYLAAREAHKLTVGMPAPLPEFEVFRTIADKGGEFAVVENEGEAPEPSEPRDYRALRLLAYRQRGATETACIEAIIEYMAGRPEKMNELAQIRDGVKRDFPKL